MSPHARRWRSAARDWRMWWQPSAATCCWTTAVWTGHACAGSCSTTPPLASAWIDRVLVVDVPRAVQLARLQRRDGIDAGLAERMLAAQATRESRLDIADDVLYNDGPLDALDPHVAALDAQYRRLAAMD
jgi:hypothetical protein